jgi:YD repeat-containing protein
MTFGWTGINEYRCIEVKDRNGNYIAVNYDWRGDIQNVTDTLGRVITFNYDANTNLSSITQTWNGQTTPHTWASFGWENLTMQPSLAGVVGTHSGETIPVLKMVGFGDGTYTKFIHDGNGEVTRITQYASDSNPTTDNHPRNYTAFDYDSATNDCPRLTAMRTWAEYWTGLNAVPTEVTTYFGMDGDAHVMTAPDGTVYKETYGGSADAAWIRGLVKSSEVWAGGVQQKFSTLTWTQDNTSVSYKTNPRVIETNVYDSSGNRRRTTIDYRVATYAQYGLPYFVTEYAADGLTEIRRAYTDYNLSQPYLDRRIIGLPTAVHLTDSNGYQSKVTYGYDDPEKITSQATTATLHDQSYDASFTVRGNVTSVSRWDVTDINNGSKALTTFMSYNAAGSVLSTTDPAVHTDSIGYADSFSDGNNGRNTFAYPTLLTDADEFNSSVQYNFDFGAKTRVEGPPSQNQPNGIIQTFAYDGAGRLQRTTTSNTGAYTHYVYGPFWVQSFASVNNVAQNYLDSDLYSIQVLDGVGRVFGTASNHPGSVGGYRLAVTIYDGMGRGVLQTRPFEVDSSWTAAGDDVGGVPPIAQSYDWKGRPRITTNTDGTQKYASYSACGCAGGEVTTLTDEVGRQQKVYSDVLGRKWKSEVLNWDGSVYSATTNSFNARDQVTLARQWAGAESGGGAYQDTIMTYDGYGRLHSKHVPEQNAGTATTWSYNPDDTINSVTDARGASGSYTYNSRRLLTEISYSAPAGITPTSNVTFSYDAAGNRTSMIDGMGSQSYVYDDLSRISSETRTFTGVSGSFTLSYEYNLAGELKKFTDATGMAINYGLDSSGRLNAVTGSGNLYSNVSNYASNFQYRAWGGLKGMTDGSNRSSSWTYNTRLQPLHFEVSGNLVSQSYDYNPDGRISFVHNTTDGSFDRSYSYDHVARLGGAASGGVARGDSGATPYNEGFGYDAFNNLTMRSTVSWGQDEMLDGATYTNNLRAGWGYDANGNNTSIGSRTYVFDAAGQITLMTGQQWQGTYIGVSEASAYDGEGKKVREVTSGQSTYYLRSSVMGDAIVEEINSSGQKNVGYVYAGGSLLARQETGVGIAWKHVDPVGASEYSSYNGNSNVDRTEFDPLGANVPLEYTPPPAVQSTGDFGEGQIGSIFDRRWANLFDTSSGCSVQGVAASCHDGMSAINNLGVARPNLIQVTINITYQNGGRRTIQFVTTSAVIGSGFNHTFRRSAAVAAATAWNRGLQDGAANALIDSIFAGFAAEADQARRFAHASQNSRQLTGTEVEKLGSNLQKLLDDPECGKFITAMLDNLPKDVWKTSKYGGSLTAAFNRIQNGGGFWSGDTGAKAAAITDPNRMSTTFNSQRVTPALSSDQAWRQLGAAFTLVHELTHVFTNAPNSGSYGHEDMARAAFNAANGLGLDVRSALMLELPTADQYGSGDDYDLALSSYYDRTLAYACRKVKL